MLDSSTILILVAFLVCAGWFLYSFPQFGNAPVRSNHQSKSQHHRLKPSQFPLGKVIPPQVTVSGYLSTHRDSCIQLYRTVAADGKVPRGYEPSFVATLNRKTTLQFLLWHNQSLIAYGALTTPECAANVGHEAHELVFGCCYGIVHPDWQGRRLGRVLLALRILTADGRNGRLIHLQASEFSKSYFEMLGFHFPETAVVTDENGHQHHGGYVVLDQPTVSQLRHFLHANEIQWPLLEEQPVLS